MIKVKLEKSRFNEPIFKIKINEDELTKHRFLKRAFMEGKSIKGEYNYKIPIRFFEPIIKNLNDEDYEFDEDTLLFYLEFSDDYDEAYYYKSEADAKYMKKWREEGCPNIYKVIIDRDKKTLTKEIAFKRISVL